MKFHKKTTYSNRRRRGDDQRLLAPVFPLRGSSPLPLLPGGSGGPPLQKPKRRLGRLGEVGEDSELWTVLRHTGQVLAV